MPIKKDPILQLPAIAVSKLFLDFFDSEKIAGLLLLAATVISIAVANSPLGSAYIDFWHQKLDLSFGPVSLNYSVEHWVNDGLMTIFFLLVGLEIERELYVGELTGIKKATLPFAAAIGGMVVPALFHFLLNNGTTTQNGVGIPMATDIAFALGMLALLGKKVPVSLKIFLTAVAIIDDLGAITVIAIFYSNEIVLGYMLAAAGIFGLLMLFQKLKIWNLTLYLIPGIILWYCILKSGIHPTIAGVLLAFAVPFGKKDEKNPSYRLQHFLHKPVAYMLLPLFALTNTALMFGEGWLSELGSNNSLGIIFGLFLGKPIGILLFCFFLIKLKWGKLPENINWFHLTGLGLLAGIGFTMSIFISNLAFDNNDIVQSSKIAVLLGSLIACLAGLSILYMAIKNNSPDTRK
jgi:NhaA family Na+:H+ antiporter